MSASASARPGAILRRGSRLSIATAIGLSGVLAAAPVTANPFGGSSKGSSGPVGATVERRPLTVSPDRIDFGPLGRTGTPVKLAVIIRNPDKGSQKLKSVETIASVEGGEMGSLRVAEASCAAESVIQSGEACSATLEWTPGTMPLSGQFIVQYEGPGSVITIPISGGLAQQPVQAASGIVTAPSLAQLPPPPAGSSAGANGPPGEQDRLRLSGVGGRYAQFQLGKTTLVARDDDVFTHDGLDWEVKIEPASRQVTLSTSDRQVIYRVGMAPRTVNLAPKQAAPASATLPVAAGAAAERELQNKLKEEALTRALGMGPDAGGAPPAATAKLEAARGPVVMTAPMVVAGPSPAPVVMTTPTVVAGPSPAPVIAATVMPSPVQIAVGVPSASIVSAEPEAPEVPKITITAQDIPAAGQRLVSVPLPGPEREAPAVEAEPSAPAALADGPSAGSPPVTLADATTATQVGEAPGAAAPAPLAPADAPVLAAVEPAARIMPPPPARDDGFVSRAVTGLKRIVSQAMGQ